jgi:hypothetical protein
MKESFESLYEYQSKNIKSFVPESLLEADDKSGPIGNIIDKAMSFVPRAVRFRKAKRTMAAALNAFEKKAKNIIKEYDKSVTERVKVIDKNYKSFMSDKIKPLLSGDGEQNPGNTNQALKLVESALKEYEKYKKDMLDRLDKEIEGILDSYTKALEKRFDSPGFVLNVELSEKGKGELKAKWLELAAIKRMKIDEYKLQSAESAGMSRLDEIISEMDSFVENRKYTTGKSRIDFRIEYAKELGNGSYDVRVFLRSGVGSRPVATEKGLIYGPEDKMSLTDPGANWVTDPDTAFRLYTLRISGVKPEDFVRPYVKIKGVSGVQYGEPVQIQSILNKPKQTGGTTTDKEDEKGVDLSAYDDINKND